MKNRFRVILAERKIKLRKVHEDTGISKSTLIGLRDETTQHPSATTILKICDYLDITPNDFFGIKKDC
ncbi:MULTISPECIES: helix-turn-helix transcriptional regulator [Staphylococcus]|uniref:helix-turn-helix domain-containing protein n=1 Tax=Staphylococcus TaxID=1279 RepID=UPI0007644457|nr:MULTISPECIES: helix-turn-helix transcriptional regulator [Staphylococcus]KXA47488.1 toxin-antitoxin system, antitoxin component, Xre family [Staphylococcus simulans]OFM14440.1 transcriptional regulator [Staphylococcus sp. HMSC059E03]OFN19693.1 transcriptional regulator [Staphylococcus sp. HMSC055C03]OFV05148.1 transcriptional regulator [Staphylococcus sp. HMSC12H08]OHR07299.1 transcriptional regulator [Staphylococcus sp. HMSC078A12]